MNPLLPLSIVAILGIGATVIYMNSQEPDTSEPTDESRDKSIDDLDEMDKKGEEKKEEKPEGVIPSPDQKPADVPPVIPVPPPERSPSPEARNVVYDSTGKFRLYWEEPYTDSEGKTDYRIQYNSIQINEALRRNDRTFCDNPKLQNHCSSFDALKEMASRREKQIEEYLLGVSPIDPRSDFERDLDMTLWNSVFNMWDNNETSKNVAPFVRNERASAEYLNSQCRKQKIGYEYREDSMPGTVFRGFSREECSRLNNLYPSQWFPSTGTCIQEILTDGHKSMGTNFSSACGGLPTS